MQCVAARCLGRLRCWRAELVAGLAGAAWFFHVGFGPTLDPTDIAWMLRGDWAQYLWGFSFFRQAEWSFPLGSLPNLHHPVGTSLAFMDSNPWFSVLFRLLSPGLPRAFHFAGIWYLLCFVLQGVFGARVAAAFSQDKPTQALGGALFVVTPVLVARANHTALCAFFFLTASLSLSLEPTNDRRTARRKATWSLLLLAWAAGTHVYLTVMLFALTTALFVQLWLSERIWSGKEFALAIVSASLTTFGIFHLFGYVGWRRMRLLASGFGDYSANLLTLFDSQGWSRWVAPLPHSASQSEGFQYLGVGVGALLLLRLALWARNLQGVRESLRRCWPLVLVVFGMAVYALSSKITLGDALVLDLEAVYRPITTLTFMFRSSGRFAWPLHLALIAAAVSTVGALRAPLTGRLTLSLAVLLQCAEFATDRVDFAPVTLRPLDAQGWQQMQGHFEHLVSVPIHLSYDCRFDEEFVNRLSAKAYDNHLTLNSANVARKARVKQRVCERHLASDESLDPRTVYVVEPDYLADFVVRDAICGRLDDLIVCIDRSRQGTPLAGSLSAQKSAAL